MIKTIEEMNASEDKRKKVMQLYMQSDELAWLGEHCNRESDDTEIAFKQKRAEILRLRDQIISGEITDYTKLVADYDKRNEKLQAYAAEKE